MIILHCLYIRISLPGASTIIVTSKVTRHRCISTTCTILQGYTRTLDSFVEHWFRQTKGAFLLSTILVRIWEVERNLHILNSQTLFNMLSQKDPSF